MTVALELWQLISLLLAFFGACAGVLKLLLAQVQKHIDTRFASQDSTRQANHDVTQQRLDGIESAARAEAGEWRRIEREVMTMKAEMPLHYVRREDYIRGQSVIEAKLDALALKLENVQLRRVGAGD